MLIQEEIDSNQLSIRHKQEQIQRINNISITPSDTVSLYYDHESDFQTDSIGEFNKQSEQNARMEVNNRQIEKLHTSILTLTSSCDNNAEKINQEEEITALRCEQLREVLLARISAYWIGVLQKDKKTQDIPPIFPIDSLELDNI